ncbi:hypothetical protein [Parvicella tangerina]|uniref:Uncharacterized protein n=1 Tax=Parvicella tangerina TaxID=2829795 RepID=A0A916JQW8_9FLAO|nr:hypothetical protein [Parvicella tangerina]CAG5086849.1 hypothetical protein CRYO30217_03305 [Parvicella tangerina]
MDKFNQARLKYKPTVIKYLLVAETPPKSDSNRFFYFEYVDKQDSLFLEIMKVLYPIETSSLSIKEIRLKKEEFLNRFKTDGFYLIDSLDKPFEEKYSSRQKIELIRKGQVDLLSKITKLLSSETKVILIASPVYKANIEFLKANKVPVINSEFIDFPGSGGQKKFREKMWSILNNI